MNRLRNRVEAGRLLAGALHHYREQSDVLVLALPRGGVPVAYEVASALKVPLDVFLIRKLGVPGDEEFAIGAISNGGDRILNHEVIDARNISKDVIDAVVEQEMIELRHRESVYRQGKAPLLVKDKTVVLIDDGLATGSVMLSAIRALKAEESRKIIAAVPVAPKSTCEKIRLEADEMICLYTPSPFWGVGVWYEDFGKTTDNEVLNYMKRAQSRDMGLPCSHRERDSMERGANVLPP